MERKIKVSEPAKQQEPCRICGKRPPYADGMELCAACMGFEPSQEGSVTQEAAATSQSQQTGFSSKIKATPERPCSGCGRTPSETKFYPSRKDKCVECIKARQGLRKAEEPRTYTEIHEQESAPAQLDPMVSAEIDAQVERPDLPVHDSELCKCRNCGASFEAYRTGAVVVTNYCRDCLNDRLKVARKPELRSCITLDFDQDRELFDALADSARQERRTMVAQAITLLERTLIKR